MILASASPRRRELLSLLWRDFECRPTHIDETPYLNESPERYVARIARAKSMACSNGDALVVAADTSVTIDGDILGKPIDKEHAGAMLARLSGRTHHVFTAVSMRRGDDIRDVLVSAKVTFVDLSPQLIGQYLTTDEPWDKAGAYGIQGRAGSFVQSLNGSYSAVVGLPLAETRALMRYFGYEPDWGATPCG